MMPQFAKMKKNKNIIYIKRNICNNLFLYLFNEVFIHNIPTDNTMIHQRYKRLESKGQKRNCAVRNWGEEKLVNLQEQREICMTV